MKAFIVPIVPAQTAAPARFVGARSFAAIPDVPNWWDLTPRFGAAYDLFGNGKTALKGSMSRYVNLGGLAVTSTGSALDPFTASVNSATRTWTDADVDFVPDCDLTSPVANGECGLISNTNFGRTSVTTHWDPDYLTGWGKRGFNWEGSVSLQQRVRPGMSVDVAYYRRWYGNHTGTDNLLTTSADFDPYCVNVAADPRLPNPGGYSLCGLYEIRPALFGRFDNLVSPVERFGKITEYWHGVDINVDVRAVRGVQLSGGMSIGRGVLDTCDVASKVDNPAGTTVSAMGLSTLARPTRCIAIRRFQPSRSSSSTASCLSDGEFACPRVFKTIRALPVAANASILASQTTLGRSFSAGLVTIPLYAPGTKYEDRGTQIDFRFSRRLRVKAVTVTPNVDMYNAFNANTILVVNNTYGANWDRPTYVLPGRLLKFGAQVAF